jgi:hypothetical protein
MLPIVAGSIAEGIADARDLYGALSEGLAKPQVLDDATLDRVEAVYSETLEWVEVYERQLHRWQLPLAESNRGDLSPPALDRDVAVYRWVCRAGTVAIRVGAAARRRPGSARPAIAPHSERPAATRIAGVNPSMNVAAEA